MHTLKRPGSGYDFFVFLGLAVLGAAVWIITAAVAGTEEAFDSASYWFLGVPLMLLVAFCVGRARPGASWLWGIALVAPQPVLLLASEGRNATASPLWGLGLVLFLILLWICSLASLLGARSRFLQR